MFTNPSVRRIGSGANPDDVGARAAGTFKGGFGFHPITLRAHRHGILAAIRLGLSNGRLEGPNSTIRLVSHRSFGYHSAEALIALVYLCCTIELPR